MFKVDEWFKKIASECGCKAEDVERAYRTTRNELMKQGLQPDDPKYNSELMMRTKKKVMKESLDEEKSNIDKLLTIFEEKQSN